MSKYLRGKAAAVLIAIVVLGGLAGCMKTSTPVACFRAEPSIGYAPLTVAFDASCSFVPEQAAGVYGFVWDFDDGSEGTGRTITHAFLSPGTYMVSVGMIDSGGVPVDGAVRTITVLPSP